MQNVFGCRHKVVADWTLKNVQKMFLVYTFCLVNIFVLISSNAVGGTERVYARM